MKTIKEIIDAERWGFSGSFGTDMNSMQHNASLDRIEGAVTKRIAELEFDKANLVDRIIGLEIHKTGVIGQANRIAELEAELKKARGEA